MNFNKEQTNKLMTWVTLVTDMLKNSDELKNDIMSLNELDDALRELKVCNKQESKDDYTVDKVLEVNFKVITHSGKERIISYKDIKNSKGLIMDISRGLSKGSICEIKFATQCDGFDLEIN